nr:DUF4351 domain-containing protein [Alcanivorax quisquiliarum]
MFRLEHQRSLDELTEVLGLLVDWLKTPEQASLRRAFAEWLRRRLRHWVPEANISQMHDLQEVHDMTQSMVEIWKEKLREQVVQEVLQEGRLEGLQEGRQEGRREGRQEGRREGRQEGRREGRQEGEFSLLLRQLTRRFGPLPDADIARLKRAGLDELELWADRVLDAASLEGVFR